MREHEISFENFNQDPDKVPAINGTCEKDYLFTPDGKYCHKCNNNIFGMPGCKGGCNFSLKRNHIINCEGECKEGYIESSEGVCTDCGAINKGCHECHYEDEYPKDYSGVKKLRKFICDFCEEGFMLSNSGKCLDCKDLGLDEKLVVNSKHFQKGDLLRSFTYLMQQEADIREHLQQVMPTYKQKPYLIREQLKQI